MTIASAPTPRSRPFAERVPHAMSEFFGVMRSADGIWTPAGARGPCCSREDPISTLGGRTPYAKGLKALYKTGADRFSVGLRVAHRQPEARSSRSDP